MQIQKNNWQKANFIVAKATETDKENVLIQASISWATLISVNLHLVSCFVLLDNK